MAKDTPLEQYLARKAVAASFHNLQPVCKGLLRQTQSQEGGNSEFKDMISKHNQAASTRLNSDFEWFVLNLVKGVELGIKEAGLAVNINQLSIGREIKIEEINYPIPGIMIDPIHKKLVLNPELVMDSIANKNLTKEHVDANGHKETLTAEESIQLIAIGAMHIAAKQMETAEHLRLLLGKRLDVSQSEIADAVEEKTLQALPKIRQSRPLPPI